MDLISINKKRNKDQNIFIKMNLIILGNLQWKDHKQNNQFIILNHLLNRLHFMEIKIKRINSDLFKKKDFMIRKIIRK